MPDATIVIAPGSDLTRLRTVLQALRIGSWAPVLGGVLLVPSSGAMFRIEVGEVTVWNRKTDGGFPEIAVLKRLVRDLVAPTMSLGHSDSQSPEPEPKS